MSTDFMESISYLAFLSFDFKRIPDNKTDHHDITEILLKVALNTIDLTKPFVS
jgi:hypothetical protein